MIDLRLSLMTYVAIACIGLAGAVVCTYAMSRITQFRRLVITFAIIGCLGVLGLATGLQAILYYWSPMQRSSWTADDVPPTEIVDPAKTGTTTTPVSENPTTTTQLRVAWETAKEVKLEDVLEKMATPDELRLTKIEADNVMDTRLWYRGKIISEPYRDWSLYFYGRREKLDIGLPFIWKNVIIVSSNGEQAYHMMDDVDDSNILAWQKDVLDPLMRVELHVEPMPQSLTTTEGKTLYALEGRSQHEPRYECTPSGCPMATSVAAIRTTDNRVLYEQFSESIPRVSEGLFVTYDELGNPSTYASVIRPDQQANSADPTFVFSRSIQWSPGVNVGDVEGYMAGVHSGCGTYGSTIVDATRMDTANTRVVGSTDAGDPVYAPTTPLTHPAVKDAYDAWFDFSYSTEKPSMQEFLERFPTPIIFWKNAFGQWVEYRANGSVPTAECGKPVIYLYPPSTTEVSVRLPSFVHVTVSEPSYPTNGWRVTADPSGMLATTSGTSYGSLYWEGTGVSYKLPREGFVVRAADLDSFFSTTLPQYGLNVRETTEFKDFWLSRMTDAPYYRIKILTDGWAKAVPLSVSPVPQTHIRIFMDWAPLTTPVKINTPTIITPTRNGFTLVEWGGTLWK